jgi:hypothetical protein
MSINPYKINDQAKGSYGVDYNGYASMYRAAIQDHHFKRAKELEADMKREDERLSKEGEQ